MEIIRRFEETVKNNSDSTAIIDNEGPMTFQALKQKALKIAARIETRLDSKINQPVGVYLSESADYVAAILGIIYSGNFYVPFVKKSAKRLFNLIVENIQPSIIITDFESAADLVRNAISVSKQLILEEVFECSTTHSTAVKGYQQTIESDPVYIMHTSGSTGIPKGVVIPHVGLIDYIDWVGETFQLNTKNRISSKTSFSFDNSILDIFSMVFFGSLLVIKRHEAKNPDVKQTLVDMLHELTMYNINFVFWAPLYLKLFADHDLFKEGIPHDLEQVLFCGEVMPNKQLNYWRKHLPDAQYANLYGPTEVTDVCSYYIVDRPFRDDEALPIGRACENMSVLILNDHLQPITPPESGEIYVRGIGLASGYWRNQAETTKSFVQNPTHDDYLDICYKTGDLGTINEYGEILFLGRKDTQIKYYGTRIELGEIELIARSIQEVEDCVVLFEEEKSVITLFYQARDEIEKLTFMRFLHDKVWALPTRYVHMPQLPHNQNGKVDRVALKRML